MKYDYSDDVAEVISMIYEFGADIQLKKADIPGTYDPGTDTSTPGTPGATYDVSGLILDPDEEYIASVGGNNIEADDQLIYLGPTIEPEETDTVIMVDGEVWQVVHITKLAPGGTPVLYTIQVRP